jgi:2',3'-cyclic-nucleotide 2'-phosphodiesterase (5'-nucleotidase family)
MRQIIGGKALALCLISQLAVAQVIPPLPVPTRPLEWGDVNFLSTSDTHGELVALPSQSDMMLSVRD